MIMPVTPNTDEQALEFAFKSYVDRRGPDYDPSAMHHHFDAFHIFANSVIGDTLRKIKDHLFPKIHAAGLSGISIKDVSILPRFNHEGEANELVVRVNGDDRFIVRTLHTRSGRSRRTSDTVVLLRAGEQLGITHANLFPPDEANAQWSYDVYDGPGVILGLVEACDLIHPFISAEVAEDTVSIDRNVVFALGDTLVKRDGGLPGKLVAEYGRRVLTFEMGAIFDWLSTALPMLAEKLGDNMTWPEKSLHYDDQDESVALIRAPGTLGIVQFIGSSADDPNYASMQVLRMNGSGTSDSAETYLIPIGHGELIRAIETLRRGENLDNYLSMSFDYRTREMTTSTAFLEAKQYQYVGSTVLFSNIDWKGRREENFVDGVERFRDYDGLNDPLPVAISSMAVL
jgi:hypothetical protein